MTMLKTLLIVLVLVSILPAVYADKDTNKKLCEKNGGDWTNRGCDFDDDDEDKVDRYLDDQQRIEKFEEERAADEDALCDDPEDSAKFEVCQSATLAFASSDKDKDDLTKHDVDVLCDASEDYEAHKEQCDKLYDKVQDATLAFASDKNDYIVYDEDSDRYTFKSQDGDNEATHYFKDKDDAEKAYKNLDRDELTHSDKSFNDWEYDDEEHPSLR